MSRQEGAVSSAMLREYEIPLGKGPFVALDIMVSGEETGVKFIVFLNNLKLKHTLRLLETTNLKVYEVAEKVGYSNLSCFSTVFKKNFGQNPFDYKNNCKNGENRY